MIYAGLILGLALAFYCILNILNGVTFRKMLRQPQASPGSFSPVVSVIIPVRNEESMILSCLESVLKQDYPQRNFEVIVVNDHSTDSTEELIKNFKQLNPMLKYCELEPDQTGKKAAITKGIEIASGEIIMTTDADCIPASSWISSMSSLFDTGTAVVCGPVVFKPLISWFEKFQALEFSGLQATGAAFIGRGYPVLANGANLAYRKSAFIEAGGFAGNAGNPSGDDEFLVQKISRKKLSKVKFCLRPGSLVCALPHSGIGAFLEQRKRWVSKSSAYPDKKITVTLAIVWLGMLFFPFSLFFSFFHYGWLFALLFALFFKVISEFWILKPASGFFGISHLLFWLPVETLLHTGYLIWAGIAGNFSGYEWKGRKIK